MKIVSVILILSSGFFVGYNYKHNMIKQTDFFIELKNFVGYFKSNLNLFKTNVIEIFDNYIIKKKKSANISNYFIKNAEIYQINEEKLNKIIKNKQECFIICNFFKTIGTNEYEFEIQKIISFEKYLDEKISEYSLYAKNKGELFFKIALSVSAVIAILIW